MIIAGTGHRPDKLAVPGLELYSQAQHDRLTAFAELALDAYREDLRQIISGFALGWDLALAQAAVNLGVPLVAAVPFAGQESRWRPEDQARYRDLLARAQKVHVVSPGGFSAYKMQVRNEFMVKQCYLLLALHDGSLGGTANCIEFAEDFGRGYRNLWPEWQAYLKETA